MLMDRALSLPNFGAVKTALRIGWILLCLALAFASRCWNVRDVFIQGHIYFVDGDCYSRMTRAQMVAEHPGIVVHHHDFENWPEGVNSHTTAPFDYLIVGLKPVLDVFFRWWDPMRETVLHDQTLDLAGALVSPLLGVAGALFIGWWLARFRVRFGAAALLIYAISPILVHGTLLGRPDHQSLLMLTITVAFGAELALAGAVGKGNGADAPQETKGSPVNVRAWGIVSGLAWALSLWVSLYEPSILLVLVLLLWLLLDRRALFSRQRLPGAIAFVAVIGLSLFIDGWPVSVPSAEVREYFPRWELTIGELSHPQLSLLFSWFGWTALASPVLLLFVWRQDRRVGAMLIVLVALFLLTLWQVRWGYFLAIAYAWTLPWQLQALRRAWLAAPLFLVGLWPVLHDWDGRLFPNEIAQEEMSVQRGEVVALRNLVTAAIGSRGGPFLASWWLSPSIAYWSGQPGVGGTSHESLPGIVDSARFFLSTDPASAAAILRKRRVRWVLADDPARALSTSSVLLGITPPENALATTLFDKPEEAPDYLHEWKGIGAVNKEGLRFYRLYEVDNAKLPP
jgi:hypothetical protein